MQKITPERELAAALLGPIATVALLLLVGVSVSMAVVTMFACTFTVTTVMDVRWLLCRRHARKNASGSAL